MLRWEYAKAVYSEFFDRVLLVGAELFSDKEKSEGSGRGFEPIQPLGIRARPRDPDVDSENNPTDGAGMLIAWDGDEGHAMPVGDPRALEQLPEGQPGSVYKYACTESGKPSFSGIEGDGSHMSLAQYPNENKAHVFSMEVHEANKENISLRHGLGQGLVMTADGGGKLILSSPNGQHWIEISNDGITLNGKVKNNGGFTAGDPTLGQNILTKADLSMLANAITLTLVGLQSTAPGSPVSNTVPLLAATLEGMIQGSSAAKASP